VLVSLHWTLAQYRMAAGLYAESLATLDQALRAPGLTASQRGRLLVLAARTHTLRGELEKADRIAQAALAGAMRLYAYLGASVDVARAQAARDAVGVIS
jgi:hypothetical protein